MDRTDLYIIYLVLFYLSSGWLKLLIGARIVWVFTISPIIKTTRNVLKKLGKAKTTA